MEQDKTLDFERDARVLPVVKAIFEEVAALPDMKMGLTPEGMETEDFKQQKMEVYKDLTFKIVKKMIDNGVKMSEMKYLFMAAMEPVSTIQSFADTIINAKYDDVLAKFYGVEGVEDISVSAIEAKIVENAG